MKSLPIALTIAAAALAGCGGGDVPDVVPVSGKATVGGQPLSDSELVFVPDSVASSEGRPATAYTDSEGNYTLYYKEGVAGTPPGKYKVVAQDGGEFLDEDGNFLGNRPSRVDESVDLSVEVTADKDAYDLEFTPAR